MPDRQIRGEGTSEACWQGWAGLHQLGTCPISSIVPEGGRAVVVAPHPDDEVLAFGGLLAILAAAGKASVIVAVTDGDASHPHSTQWPPSRLAVHRTRESQEGLKRLGVHGSQRIQLGIPDGAVTSHVDRLAARLGEIVQPGDVLLSTWALDGHPDHEASATAAAKVSHSHGCRHVQSPVWMWHWAKPADERVPWHCMKKLSLPPAVRQKKRHAILAHETQLCTQDTGQAPVLGPSALARLLRPDEYFIFPEGLAP